MPKRIPVNTVVVHRDGKRVVPPHGKPFDFTAQEIKDFEEKLPGSLAKVTVVVEDDDDGDEVLNPPIAVTDSRGGTGDDEPQEPAPKAKAKVKAPKAKDDDEGL